MHRSRFSVLLALLVAGCGGANDPPRLSIDFPAPYSHVEGINMTEITVRGRASASGEIRGVTINGIAAQSEDGFATWQAVVPLEESEGENVIQAVLDLAQRNGVATASAIVRALPPFPAEPEAVLRDPQTGTIYVGDWRREAIYRWDHAAPERFDLVAGESRREGRKALEFPRYPIWEPHAGRILFLGRSRLHSLDPLTGEVTVIADNAGKGSGPDLPLSALLFVDPADANGVYATKTMPSSSYTALLRIDLASGDRTVVTELGPDEPALESVAAGAVDSGGNRLFLAHAYRNEIVVLDLASMERELVVLPEQFSSIGGMDYDAVAEQLYFTVNSGHRPRLYRYDVESAELEPVSGIVDTANGAIGAGPRFERVSGVSLDAGSGKAYVADSTWNTVFTVDLESGDREAVLPRAGEGPRWATPADLAFGTGRESLLVLDMSGQRIVELPLDGAASRVLVESETLVGRLTHLRRDDASDSLVVMSDSGRIFVVSATGQVTALPLLSGPFADLAVDGLSNLAWLIVAGASNAVDSIGRLDLVTGSNEIISGEGIGDGEQLRRANRIARDPETGDLLVWNRDSVVVVSPETGNRVFHPLDPVVHIDGMVFVPDQDCLFVSEYSGIYRYVLGDSDLDTVVSAYSGNKLPGMSYADGFIHDPDKNVIYLASASFGAVFMIDLVSGDEVILAR